MAQALMGRFLSIEASDDMTNDMYKFVMLTADGKVKCADNNALVIGTLQNKPKKGESALVCLGETSKVILGGNVSVGNKVISDAEGKAIVMPAVAGKYMVAGIALENGVSGDIIEILLRPMIETI